MNGGTAFGLSCTDAADWSIEAGGPAGAEEAFLGAGGFGGFAGFLAEALLALRRGFAQRQILAPLFAPGRFPAPTATLPMSPYPI